MFIIILKSNVSTEKWPELKSKFQTMSNNAPTQLTNAFLVQEIDQPNTWKLISVWKSKADLMEYRKAHQTPEGIVLFRSVGSEPEVSLNDVAGSFGAGK